MMPLQDKRVLVTRDADKAYTLTSLIEQQGGISIEIPLLHFHALYSRENQKLLERIEDFEWLFFTSANGVHFFFTLLDYYQINRKKLSEMNCAVVGTKTEKALQDQGVPAQFVPHTFTGQSMGKHFAQEVSNENKVLVIQGNLARQAVVKELTDEKFHVETAILYETNVNVKMKEKLKTTLQAGEVDILTFTSPSTIKAFIDLADLEWGEKVATLPCVCIGPTTEEAAIHYGFQSILAPNQYTVEGMMEVMVEYVLHSQ
ncbi:uroporphyrinogen-III synthase [Pontibacillus salicampi]|uniref:Uroporphyrinogen-III synthase n=1 Tax=Pontibacillus salicampi TaxID=1449801 RepID=A0ABV6LJ67_9BACI